MTRVTRRFGFLEVMVGMGFVTPIHPTKETMKVGWLLEIVCGLRFCDANPPYKRDDKGGLAIRNLMWIEVL